MFDHIIICGSPRVGGRCEKLAIELFDAMIENDGSCEYAYISIADMDINGCNGCNGCKTTGDCVLEDDMEDVMAYINDSQEITIVCPIYMAGVPSQFKAVLDRLQPNFWTNKRHNSQMKKAHIYLIGEGKDPFGYEGAISSIKSALYLAGFEVSDVIKRID